MDRQTKVNQMHEKLNDAFMDLQGITVVDEQSRESKQCAILSLVAMRKLMEDMGLTHSTTF